jgi:hypothetical protein
MFNKLSNITEELWEACYNGESRVVANLLCKIWVLFITLRFGIYIVDNVIMYIGKIFLCYLEKDTFCTVTSGFTIDGFTLFLNLSIVLLTVLNIMIFVETFSNGMATKRKREELYGETLKKPMHDSTTL